MTSEIHSPDGDGEVGLTSAPSITESALEVIRLKFYTADIDFGQVVCRALGTGFEVRLEKELKPAGSRGRERFDAVLLDLRGCGSTIETEEALRLLDQLTRTALSPPIIVMLEDDEPTLTRRLIEGGAYDALPGPFNVMELRLLLRRACRLNRVERELEQLRSQQCSTGRLEGLIGFTDGMQQVFSMAKRVAPCDVTVLVTGETGTGKSMLARAIHRLSPRNANPFVAFSCANLPENLVEDELFGHEKGAFTGALTLRRGRFEAADTGTLFLDEIGDLPLGLQAKLLRVLHERTFERLGSNEPLTADFRLLAATHRNLPEMVKRGEFREDLFYRLNVIEIHLPALRERDGGIVVLAQYLLQRVSKQLKKKTCRFSRLALKAIEKYAWPGNVRQLENVIQHAVVLSDGPAIEIWHLPDVLRTDFDEEQQLPSYEDELREFKRRLLLRTIRECDGNKSEAARVLGLARGYLHRLVTDLKIEEEQALVSQLM